MISTTLTIVGNLVADPELRFTSSGTAVANLTVAANERRFDKDANKWVEGDSTFITVEIWRDLAEHVAESLVKGTRVIAVGRMRTDTWEDRETKEKRSRIKMVADAIGPELTWATAKVSKMSRASRGEIPPDDPWATGSRARPAAAGVGSGYDDEPPF